VFYRVPSNKSIKYQPHCDDEGLGVNGVAELAAVTPSMDVVEAVEVVVEVEMSVVEKVKEGAEVETVELELVIISVAFPDVIFTLSD